MYKILALFILVSNISLAQTPNVFQDTINEPPWHWTEYKWHVGMSFGGHFQFYKGELAKKYYNPVSLEMDFGITYRNFNLNLGIGLGKGRTKNNINYGSGIWEARESYYVLAPQLSLGYAVTINNVVLIPFTGIAYNKTGPIVIFGNNDASGVVFERYYSIPLGLSLESSLFQINLGQMPKWMRFTYAYYLTVVSRDASGDYHFVSLGVHFFLDGPWEKY